MDFSFLLLKTLPSVTLVFNILALALAYFLKQNKIFFLLLLIFCARSLALFVSEYQTHLFISVFLPFSFVLFVFLQDTKLVFERINLLKFAFLIFMGLVAIISSSDTNFNANITSEIFSLDFSFFKPISELSFIVFWGGFLFLLFAYLKNNELHFLLAYMGLSLQFLFYNDTSLAYYEFSSLVFIVFLALQAYKIAFFDPITKLANLKALKRYSQGLENFNLVLIELKNLNQIQANLDFKASEYVLSIFAMILKKILHARIFKDEKDYFILIFENENETLIKSKIEMLENFIKKYEFNYLDQKIKLEIQICLSSIKNNVENSLKEAKLQLKQKG